MEWATDAHWLWQHARDEAPAAVRLDPALLAPHRQEGQAALVRIDHRDARYWIEWRAVDLATGQATAPAARATPDRAWVAKGVCLALTEALSPTAAITPSSLDATRVILNFRGAQWKESLAAALGSPCLLQPYRVVRDQGETRWEAIPRTVLRLDPATPGQATVISNYADRWKPAPRVIGFHAVKLRTQNGPLQVRVLDAVAGQPVRQCQVYVGDEGFKELGDTESLGAPDREGRVFCPRPLRRLAFVRVAFGASEFQWPFPITSAECELVCRLPHNPQASAQADLMRDLRYHLQDVQSLQAAVESRVRLVNRLNSEKQYEEALAQVKQTEAALGPLRQSARTAHNDLERRAAEQKLDKDPLLRLTGDQLRSAEARSARVRDLQASLQATLDKLDAQSRADVLANLGRDFELAGDIPEAMARYELALNEQPDQPIRFECRVEDGKLVVSVVNHATGHNFPGERHNRKLLIQVIERDAVGAITLAEQRVIKDVTPFRGESTSERLRVDEEFRAEFPLVAPATVAEAQLLYKRFPFHSDREALVVHRRLVEFPAP